MRTQLDLDIAKAALRRLPDPVFSIRYEIRPDLSRLPASL